MVFDLTPDSDFRYILPLIAAFVMFAYLVWRLGR